VQTFAYVFDRPAIVFSPDDGGVRNAFQRGVIGNVDLGRGERKRESAARKEILEILDDGPLALNSWMMERHQHAIGGPCCRTAISVGGIHRCEQSVDDETPSGITLVVNWPATIRKE
jgi:hypothetical protein